MDEPAMPKPPTSRYGFRAACAVIARITPDRCLAICRAAATAVRKCDFTAVSIGRRTVSSFVSMRGAPCVSPSAMALNEMSNRPLLPTMSAM